MRIARTQSIRRTALAAVAFSVVTTVGAGAQQAVTVSGHVTASGAPLAGAHVRVNELTPRIDRTTDAEGRYSFVVPSSSVHGQSVTLVATMQDRRMRYLASSVVIELAGGAIIKDFDLKVVSEGQQPGPEPAANVSPPGVVPRVAAGATERARLGEPTGATDLASALAGLIPGLSVEPASVLGGSASLAYRGPRSILASSQPLFVVDGMPVDNSVFASAAQRFGLGGFDYGSPLADFDVADIASYRFLSGAEAAALFGGRGANGVVLLATKSGAEGPGLGISASYQQTSDSFVRLPVFQNQYGQGLDGKFEFFNGRGGGINDAVDQNWGPALDGRPLAQASYTQAGQPDVRLWTARPDNVRNYFDAGRTSNVNAAVQGQNDLGSFRVFAGSRDSHGISPSDRLSRLTGGAHFTFRPDRRFQFDASAFGAQTKSDDAPGSGFNEGNPVSQFTRMGRQVDTDSLQRHLRDATGKQISWNYAGHNNPFFVPLADSNYSHRYHVAGGASATYAISPWLSATARGGSDYYHDGRLFSIAPGWMGGFPFYAGAGDFSKGGSEGDLVLVTRTSAAFRLDATRALAHGARWTVGAGADLQRDNQRIQSLGVDSVANVPAAGAPDTAKVPPLATWVADAQRSAVFAETGVTFADGASVVGTLRNEWASIVPGQQSASSLYPSVRGSLDLVRSLASMRGNQILSSATLHGAWWRDAGDLTPFAVQTMYAGRAATGSLAPLGVGLLVGDPSLTPEITSAWQLGADLALRAPRIGLGLTYFRESTSGVILPVADATLGTITARNAGAISNGGIEAQLSAAFGDRELGLGWDISANALKNNNNVDQLSGNVQALSLGPPQWGMNVQALKGWPLGVLVGRRLLRDPATNSLLLRNGLPLPDSVSGPQPLGVAQPSWVFGLRNTLGYRWVSLSVLADAHVGGDIFSGTNLWGSYAGTLQTTAFRPDSGLLITGIDVVSRAANTKHVSTQDYYHALGAIQEPWVYSASYFTVREARVTFTAPTSFSSLPFASMSASIIGRNLYMWSKAPNIDPAAVFSPNQVPGLEMGQLPATKSVGVQVTIVP